MQVINGGQYMYGSSRRARRLRRRSVLCSLGDILVTGYLLSAAAGFLVAIFWIFTGLVP